MDLHGTSCNINKSIEENNKCKTYEPTNGRRQQNCVELEEIYKKFGWIMGYRSDAYYNDIWIGTADGLVRMLPDDWHYEVLIYTLQGASPLSRMQATIVPAFFTARAG